MLHKRLGEGLAIKSQRPGMAWSLGVCMVGVRGLRTQVGPRVGNTQTLVPEFGALAIRVAAGKRVQYEVNWSRPGHMWKELVTQ
jgi:hypothetical protein